MNITLKLDAKTIKYGSYRLNPKYNERVHRELDKILEMDIIEPMEESNWVIPMVVYEKKQKDEISIFIDPSKLNDASVHDPFLTLFIIEVLENVAGKDAYSFTDGFFWYHQINIM